MPPKQPVKAPARIARGAPKERGGKSGPRRTTSHKFRAQDFVRKRQNESLEDHYSMGKLLGEGQFGEVFIGTVKKSNGGKGDNRAIKRIQKELMTEEDHEEVFNEFNILKGLDHPNIAKMFEFFEDQDSFWFVQELCSGGELLDELERTETFPEAAAALIMKQVLASINYCHTQKHVVHRDLKLENILLVEGAQKASNGETYNPMTVKVIDFGLGANFTEDQVFTSPVGSMHYVAPEVLEQEYGYKCDIWSCGVIAYILLCGYAPFEGANDRDMRELIMMGNISFADEIWKNRISQDAKDFVTYLLTYEPEKRPDAGQALQHEWIKKASKVHAEQFKATKSGTDAAVRVLSNIRSFEAKSKLKQATCAFMTSQLVLSGDASDDDAADADNNDNNNDNNTRSTADPSTSMMIGEIFRAIDTDSDGSISLEELRLGFLDFLGDSAGLTVEEVDDIFSRVDLACTGFIEFSEFVVASMGLHDQEQAHHKMLLKQAFERLLDKDGSGFLSYEKLKAEMAPFYGDDVEEHIIQKIIDQADADQDGKISWDDFHAMMSKTADFVPPENATPLSSYQKQAAATAQTQSLSEKVKSPKAEATPLDTAARVADGSPSVEEKVVPVDTTTTTSPATRRKSRSSAGPKSRLISAMFEKNLEKNREMGFDKFTYTQPTTTKADGPKRKLPRTRRVNFDELTKKANATVNFDPNAVKAGRNKEIEQLKSSPGAARQRRATIVNMFQQENPETRNRRESRLLELQSLKSPTDRNEKVRNMFNKPHDTGLSKARMKAEQLIKLQKTSNEADEVGEAAPSKAQMKADELMESQKAFDEADESKQEGAVRRNSLSGSGKTNSISRPLITGQRNTLTSPGMKNLCGGSNSANNLDLMDDDDAAPGGSCKAASSATFRKRAGSFRKHELLGGSNRSLNSASNHSASNSASSLDHMNNDATEPEEGIQKASSNSSWRKRTENSSFTKRNGSASSLIDLMNNETREREETKGASSQSTFPKRVGDGDGSFTKRNGSASSLIDLINNKDTTEGSTKTSGHASYRKRVGNASFTKPDGNGSFHSVGKGESSELPETRSPALSPMRQSVPNIRNTTPTNQSPFGASLTPRGSRVGGRTIKRATAPAGGIGMTEAQAKFLEMANERAKKANATETKATSPEADDKTATQ